MIADIWNIVTHQTPWKQLKPLRIHTLPCRWRLFCRNSLTSSSVSLCNIDDLFLFNNSQRRGDESRQKESSAETVKAILKTTKEYLILAKLISS